MDKQYFARGEEILIVQPILSARLSELKLVVANRLAYLWKPGMNENGQKVAGKALLSLSSHF